MNTRKEENGGNMNPKRKCEKCSKVLDIMGDYCAVCYKNLCDECMDKGHCGNTPAKSGCDEDAKFEGSAVENKI
jgi:hypothetical protein